MSLSRLLYPQSIAFIGGKECEIAIRRTLELGFPGAIYAIHPHRTHLAGILTKPSLNHIEQPIDAAFVAVKREPTIEIVHQLRAMNCGGAVIYAAGFAETGSGDLQAALLHAAGGMPLLGPNCYGFVNTPARAALWPDEHGITPRDHGIAIITQSGNIACNMTFTRRGLPLAAVFAIGNQADVDMSRMIYELAGDPCISAIGLHIEGLPDLPAFAASLAYARSQRKPVVVLKTGRSEHGAKVALSHTSSLAGADTLYDALFERYGAVRANSLTSFVETLKFLHFGPMNDGKLVSLSCSGGEAALAADLAQNRSISFPPFDPLTRAKVAATLNEFVAIDNPLDYHTFIWNDEERLTKTFTAVLSGGFDVGMLILDMPTKDGMNPDPWIKTARAFETATLSTGSRTAIVATLPECLPDDLANELAASGIAPMHGLDDALTAFESAARIGKNWLRIEPVPALEHPAVVDGEIITLTEHEAKMLLKGRGLVVPESRLCATSDAATMAEAIGFPVTLKVSASHIAHKTEAGGVALNLRNKEEVFAAAVSMSALAPHVLVERMVTGAVCELIIGVKRDPQFGLALIIGAGGVLTELLRDSAALLLPTTRQEIIRALHTLKVWKLIEGFRGKSGDQQAVIEAIEAIAHFAHDYRDRLEELDVNPLLVLPQGAVAVDALVRLR